MKNYPNLFSRFKYKTLDMRNRIVMAPMGMLSDNPDGSVSDRMIEYYRARARGGVGMVTIECQYITNKTDPWIAYMTAAGTETQMRGWQQLAEAIHAEGALANVEISCGQGRCALDFSGNQMVSASAVPSFHNPDDICRPLTVEEIHDCVAAHAVAARNAVRAGLDAIEIHAHAGYLLDQFMTEIWNKRTDEYGGSFENRMRIIKEIYEIMRAEVGPNFPLIIRFGATHDFPGGRTLEEGKKIAQYMERLGFDMLDINAGAYERKQWIIPSVYMGDACMLEYAAEIKKVVNIPVMNAGTYTPELAEKALAEGKVDLILLGRQLIADPETPNKLLDGREDEIRPCLRCSEFCMGRLYQNLPGTCAVNPQADWEREYPIEKTENPKKVAVVGGGVGGIEAALIATQMGHDVTLYEKTGELHGQVRAAMQPPFKDRLRKYTAWQKRELKRLNVNVVYNKEITADSPELAEADRIIVATGATLAKPPIEGIDDKNVVGVIDAHIVPEMVKGDNIVICGGGVSGCECALELAMQGRKVSVIEMADRIAPAMLYDNRVPLLIRLEKYGVELLPGNKVKRIGADGVEIESADGQCRVLPADTVINAFGTRPTIKLANEIAEKYPTAAIIGDAKKSALVGYAVRDGFFAAWRLH